MPSGCVVACGWVTIFLFQTVCGFLKNDVDSSPELRTQQMPYHDLSNKTTGSSRRHVLVYLASLKEYKEASTFLHSSQAPFLLSNSNSQLHTHLPKNEGMTRVVSLGRYGQLTHLYSSLLSVASLLLRSSASRLLPHPMRPAQILRTKILSPARPGQLPRTVHPMEPHRTRLTLPQTYELITHARGLSSNTFIGVYPVRVQDKQKSGRTILRQ